MTRNQYMLTAVCACLLINACVHMRNPAYREYRAVCDRLTAQQTEYYNAVERKIVPAITNAALAIAKYRPVAAPLTPARTPAMADAVAGGAGGGGESAAAVRYGRLPNVGICVVAGGYRLAYNGYCFGVGDSFLGSPIAYIDGCSFGLADGRKFAIIEGVQQ